MASQGQQQTLPAPTAASVLRFLRTCPMLWGLDDDTLTPLAKALSLRHPDSLRRYDADHRLFANEVPDRNHPLRFVTHGRANWSSSHTTEQKGAWILTPGSCFGLGTVNDWAEQRDLADTWTRSDLPSVRCQAEGVMWVLELAPDQFEPVFTASPALLGRLLAHYPTEVNAPDVVAAMKATPQFGRAAVQNLYRLLEGAPFVRFNGGGKVLQFMAQEQQEPMLLQAPVMSQEYDDP
ncbi:MAG: hypothetical protein KC457_22875, partial [Myxococcales bacterium]|nr:hypothetical protein [Myxococcales bacterium]